MSGEDGIMRRYDDGDERLKALTRPARRRVGRIEVWSMTSAAFLYFWGVSEIFIFATGRTGVGVGSISDDVGDKARPPRTTLR